MEKKKDIDRETVILFDGVCNFCNAVVHFVIKRNPKEDIRFAAIQSEAGGRMLQKYGLGNEPLHSFIFVEEGRLYQRSTAALKLCRHLKGLWPICYACMIVPVFIRDAVYNWVARNRYRWFGGRSECMVPSADVKEKFLS